MIRRRDFIKLAGALYLGMGGLKSDTESDGDLERKLLEDFLTPNSKSLSAEDITKLLFKVKKKYYSREFSATVDVGNAVNIGDGYYLTNAHIIDKFGNNSLIETQDFFSHLTDKKYHELEVLSIDRELDLALVRHRYFWKTGKAKIHLHNGDNLREGDQVSFFEVNLSNKNLKVIQIEELHDESCYSPKEPIHVGRKISDPQISPFSEIHGKVLPYISQQLKELWEGNEVDPQRVYITSLQTRKGNSGSAAFLRQKQNYVFSGIITNNFGYLGSYERIFHKASCTEIVNKEAITKFLTQYLSSHP